MVIDYRQHFFNQFGVTDKDLDRTRKLTFDHGFGDVDFPWHFSAGVANAVADFFVSQGKLTEGQKEAFTLHDWANMIGTGWFSRLMHLMALNSVGNYGAFGKKFSDYGKGDLAAHLEGDSLASRSHPLFNYAEQIESQEGLVYATATLDKDVIRRMRRQMQRAGNSIGCPVARYSVLLPASLVETDVHVKNLLERGTLHVVEERSTDEKIRMTQQWSAIDKTLSLFAAQLDRYNYQYGTPYVPANGRKQDKIAHRFDAPVDALRWPAADTRVQTIGGIAVAGA